MFFDLIFIVRKFVFLYIFLYIFLVIWFIGFIFVIGGRKRVFIFVFNIFILLNILFIVTAIAGVAVYLLQDKTTGTYIVLGAMGIKIIETSLRIMKL